MIGELATSKAGHDKDRLYMIVGEEGECVYLRDGSPHQGGYRHSRLRAERDPGLKGEKKI